LGHGRILLLFGSHKLVLACIGNGQAEEREMKNTKGRGK